MGNKRREYVRCVGCEEHVKEAQKVDGLGYVCLLCMEVLPLIWENEIEAVREARRKVQAFVADLRNRTYQSAREEWARWSAPKALSPARRRRT